MVDGFRNVDSCIAGKLSLRGCAITKVNNWESMLRYFITSRDRGSMVYSICSTNSAIVSVTQAWAWKREYDSAGYIQTGHCETLQRPDSDERVCVTESSSRTTSHLGMYYQNSIKHNCSHSHCQYLITGTT